MRRISRSTLVWIALALAGLVVAVSVSYAASQALKAADRADVGAGLGGD